VTLQGRVGRWVAACLPACLHTPFTSGG
jgi:hypothetical protein